MQPFRNPPNTVVRDFADISEVSTIIGLKMMVLTDAGHHGPNTIRQCEGNFLDLGNGFYIFLSQLPIGLSFLTI
jgi:hypothetical protein